MLIHDFLELSAEGGPERQALVHGPQRLSYAALQQASSRFAAHLQDAGVRRGDRVVVQLENSVEAVISLLGTLRAGAVIVPLGPTVKAEKLTYILDDSEAVALVTESRADGTLATVVERCPAVRLVVLTPDSDAGSPAVPLRPGVTVASWDSMLTDAAPGAGRPIDVDLAALIYTSGSTGKPKGVMLSHLNMVAAATSIGDYLQNTPDDVIINVLPLSFDYGLYQIFLALRAGASVVLERAFVYPSAILEILERESVTGLPLVPTLAAMLLKHDLRARRLAIRYVTSTGAAFPTSHIKALREQLPNARFFSMYGLTECKRVSYLPPDQLDVRPTSVGKPMDNVEVYVADEQGQLRESGEGELVIRGANVMRGYWRAPELTAQYLKPGLYPGEQLLYTGDRFRIDEQGYMYFVARLDDMLKSRGQRVSPREVEDVIYQLPGVTGVAVIGTPDALLGNFVNAVLTVDPPGSLSEQQVMRHCADVLEDYMVPRAIHFVDSLPRTESGKIDRRRVAIPARRTHAH